MAVRRAVVAAIFVLVLPLAGCVDEGPGPGDADDDPNGSDPMAGVDDEAAGLPLPTWRLGDWWRFTANDGDTVTFVVTEDAGNDWQVMVDAEEEAFFDARFDASNIGAQRKADLAGSQGADRVRYFSWPLTLGEEWTTPWDGVQRRIVVEAQDDQKAQMVAYEDDVVAVDYVFDRAARWFDRITFYDTAVPGTVVYGLTLSASGANFTGEVVRWDLDVVHEVSEENVGSYSTQPATFEVTEDHTDVWLRLDIGCAGGVFQGRFHPVVWADQAIGAEFNEQCTAPFSFQGSLGHDVSTWVVEWAMQGTEPGDVTAELMVRTLERVPVP